ncbi:MAG: flagellar hook-length control protein FliK [Treponema sp.]|nr:flagellar hook-length control protein FliK [Treponema sp.]
MAHPLFDLSAAPWGAAGVEDNSREFEKILADTFSGLMAEELREAEEGPAVFPVRDSSTGSSAGSSAGHEETEEAPESLAGEGSAPVSTGDFVEPVPAVAGAAMAGTATAALVMARVVSADGGPDGAVDAETGVKADAGDAVPVEERGHLVDYQVLALAGAAAQVPGAPEAGSGDDEGAAVETGFAWVSRENRGAGEAAGEHGGERAVKAAGEAAGGRAGEQPRGSGEAIPEQEAPPVVEGPPVEDAAGEGPPIAADVLAGTGGTEFHAAEFRVSEFRRAVPGNPAPDGSGDAERSVVRAGEGPAVAAAEEKTEQSGETRRGGRKRAVVELRDYRGQSPEGGAVSGGPSEGGERGSSGTSPAGALDTEFRVELSRTAPVTGPERGGRNGGGFEEILARELRHTVNNEIVRHAQVILREGGEGLIRLSLKPESLGNVKIRLELTENKIAGRVIVESGEALRAFERELASLEQAFRDSGYQSAELSAFLAQDGSGADREKGEPFPRFAADRAASRYDDSLEKTNSSVSEDFGAGFWPGNGPIAINMLV